MHRLLQAIEAEARLARAYTGRDHLDARVLDAIAQVPRDRFVPEAMRALAYDNSPLPIGHGQTISQPFIVALMTDLCAPSPDAVILEVGTGSGYQAAVLSRLVRQVYTIELLEPLATAAAQRLKALGYTNVEVRTGDGSEGWPERAPYDAVLVAAATPQVPQALLDQLKPGGRLVMPLGPPHMGQVLTVYEKTVAGPIRAPISLPVAFVPMMSG